MKPARGKRRAELLRELAALKDEIDKFYWTFTRCARGRPPVLVRPDLYERRAAVERELEGR
jgi:hypothetical protein